MMSDRLAEIKDGSFTAGDVMWLVSEVERLHAERDSAINEASRLHSRLTSIHRSLSDAMFSSGILRLTDLGTLLTTVIHQRRGAMTELNEIHDILAEALGYQKAPTLEEDPNCPCPGAYVTGEHTAASLAVEAAKKLARRQEHTQALGHALDRANSVVADLTRQLEHNRAARDSHEEGAQIAELQQELAEVRGTKKAELRREIGALRRVCRCSYSHEDDMLLFDTECPTHGDEAYDKRLAGEKALNTLAYVRKYFMGSEHGHEV